MYIDTDKHKPTSFACWDLTSLDASRLIRCVSLRSARRRLASSSLACAFAASAVLVRSTSSRSKSSSYIRWRGGLGGRGG